MSELTVHCLKCPLHIRTVDYVQKAAEFAPSVKFWSNAEVVLSTPLSQLAATVESCNRALEALNDSSTQTVVGCTKEYQLYCEAALVSEWDGEEEGCAQ